MQSWKRVAGGSCDSSGVMSRVCPPAPEAVLVRAKRFVSSPRHSARWSGEVPGIGAQRRSMGGKICLWMYQAVSGFRVEVGGVTSWGAKAWEAAEVLDWEMVVVVESLGTVMM